MKCFSARYLFVALAALCAFSAAAVQAADDPASNPPKKVAIRAAHMIDAKNGATVDNPVVLIEGDKITAAGPNLPVLPDAMLIDLGAATLLPGLIDCHTHITGQSGNYYENLFRRSPIDQAVVAHVYAQRTLNAGFTAVRDVGAREFIDIALRNAINAGLVVGPRMKVATLPLGSTGGHADISGFSPYLKFNQFSGVADGVDAVRKQVRENVKRGADLIKIMATAGVLSEEESVGAPQYSQEEMNAAVEEAAMWGRKVAAHAHGTEGIKRAIRAGVVSIEHGSLIDDEGIRMMKERGTYLVADIYNDDYILDEFARLGYPATTIEKERMVGRLQRENFQKAVRAGVKIAFGTDAGVYPHGWNAKQFAHMVRWGLTPMQAIQSATVSAADLMGWTDHIGSLEPGKYADVIAVGADPLKDVTVLEHVTFVMKGGVVIKDEQTTRAAKPEANAAAKP